MKRARGSAGGPSALQMAIRTPDRVSALIMLVPLAYKPLFDSGRVRSIAVAFDQRSSIMPGVPTTAEAGLPLFKAFINGGVWAPAKTSREITSLLNRHLIEIVKMPDVQEKFRLGAAELRTFQAAYVSGIDKITFPADTKTTLSATLTSNAAGLAAMANG